MPVVRSAPVDPFGYWPERMSAVAGLGGPEPSPDPAYAFHSSYVAVAEGPIAFVGRFDRLRASGGTLTIGIREERQADARTRRVAWIKISVADLAVRGEEWRIEVRARSDRRLSW